MRTESLNPSGRAALAALMILGLGHLLAFLVLFGPFLLMATGAHYGSLTPLLLLAPTLLLALAAMVYALFAVLGWATAWDVPAPDGALDSWRQLALWAGAASWLIWALVNAQVLLAFIRDSQSRHIPPMVFTLPTLGVLFGVTVGAVVIAVLLGRLRHPH